MRLKTFSFLLLFVLLHLRCDSIGKNQVPNPCSLVSIELEKSSFESAAYVKATLKTEGPALIHYWPRSFRSQRRTADKWVPSELNWAKPKSKKARPLVFSFTRPSLVGINWGDVETVSGVGRRIVSSGKYRLLLQFMLPGSGTQDESTWCVINSKSFDLEREAEVLEGD